MSQPGFVIIGAPKAGSTALFINLGRHPRIFLSPEKEPRHFSYPGKRPLHTGPGDAESTSYIVSDPVAYRALFDGCGPDQIGGEATTAYLGSEVAAENLARALPGVRIIALLRQPVDRAYSEWLHLSRDGRERLPFEAALAAEEQRQRDGWGHVWRYAQRGRYATHLRRWRKHFSESQILLIRYEDWVASPDRVLENCWRFIGVDPLPQVRVSKENETSKLPRFRLLHTLLHSENTLRRLARKFAPVGLRSSMKARLASANLEKAERLDPDVRTRLTEPFLGEIAELERMTGWNLENWKRG